MRYALILLFSGWFLIEGVLSLIPSSHARTGATTRKVKFKKVRYKGPKKIKPRKKKWKRWRLKNKRTKKRYYSKYRKNKKKRAYKRKLRKKRYARYKKKPSKRKTRKPASRAPVQQEEKISEEVILKAQQEEIDEYYRKKMQQEKSRKFETTKSMLSEDWVDTSLKAREETVEIIDENEDKIPEIKRYFTQIADKRHMVREEIDLNSDEKMDMIKYYNRDRHLAKIHLDLDYDGKFDVRQYYEFDYRKNRPSLVKKEIYTGLTEQPDIVKYYINEELFKRVLDRNNDGKGDLIEYFHEEKLVRVEKDDEFDGKIDKVGTTDYAKRFWYMFRDKQQITQRGRPSRKRRPASTGPRKSRVPITLDTFLPGKNKKNKK